MTLFTCLHKLWNEDLQKDGTPSLCAIMCIGFSFPMCGCGGTCNQGLKKREMSVDISDISHTEMIYVNDSRLLEISVLCRYISAINSKI